MDRTTELITDYATTLQYSDLTPEAIHCLKRSFVDTLGCAMGGSSGKTSVIAKKVASLFESRRMPATIIGTTSTSSPDMAAFANTVQVHYLNYDECWRDLPYSGGFPGRTIPAILALAEPLGLSGRAIMTATAVAYEVAYRLVAAVNLHQLHWNQSFYTGPASNAGIANLLGLNREQAGNSLAMTAINLLRIRQTRAGKMANWKAADPADANRAAVVYALLAREGLTAAEEAFDGQWGLWRMSGASDPESTRVDLEPFDTKTYPFKVTLMSQKLYPSHSHGISPIIMALELRDKVRLDEIESITIQGYYRALYNVGAGPEKAQRYDPETREDADHSIPWLVAVALRDGKFGPASLSPEAVSDQSLRGLMRKIRVIENIEFTRKFPGERNMSMEIVTHSGARLTAAKKYPKGYLQDPFSDTELEDKFISLAEPFLGKSGCRRVLDLIWRLDDLETFAPILEALAVQPDRVAMAPAIA